ncbi:Katanin p60 ATPase-containing subunit A1 [Platanthera zijinensis]|uniref:Katanin p60 ATPase-containing subunit A1 n=1 Tax=Platanthera zijinensis TaxID=2320716 RepID=A0AAP0FXN1_9ASPA
MEEKETNWRAEVGANLLRLHSLLFGAEAAVERGYQSTAQILGLHLIGFLDSRTVSPVDAAYIASIRAGVLEIVAMASRASAPDSDSQVFDHVRRDSGHIFVKGDDLEVEQIKNSKHYLDFLLMSEGNIENQIISRTSADTNLFPFQGYATEAEKKLLENQFDTKHGRLNTKESKLMTQMKITSIYGNNSSKSNQIYNKKLLNSESCISIECIDTDNEHSDNCNTVMNADAAYVQAEEEEKPRIITLTTKRRQTEFTSPLCSNVKSPSRCEEANADASSNGFVTAREKLEMNSRQKQAGNFSLSTAVSPQRENIMLGTSRSYGTRSSSFPRRGFRGNFVPPIKSRSGNAGNTICSRISGKNDDLMDDSTRRCLEILCGSDGDLPEKLRNLEPRLIEHISNEIMSKDPNVRWSDIAGLEHAKKCVTEMVIWPLLRPDIFCGCRSPGGGLLLFGPPGTGKTMIGKAIAGEAKATFFYISASSLTSKWIGEGEKLVRALFGVASCRQPAVIFVDEIDSLLSQRKSEGEHESSRRLKTQFLIEMEGFGGGNEQILLIGATNRPQELDEAARRRLTKRLYIPLPSSEARAWIIRNLLAKDGLFKLSDEDTASICKLTEGYSGSDMKNLVKDASMGPLREALRQGIEITKLKKEDMRPVILQDFEDSLQEVRPSVSYNELSTYEEWNRQFGSLSM